MSNFSFCSDNYCTIGATICLIFTIFFVYKKQQKKKLQCLGPRFPFGSLFSYLNQKENIGIIIQNIHNEMKKRHWKHGEIYLTATPTYFAIDLDQIKNIMKKDFQYFIDRGTYYNERDDPMSGNLFNIGGLKWKCLRSKLTSSFTSSKIKTMFHHLLECESNLRLRMQKETNGKGPIDVKEILGCFTTDVIGSCAFGLDLNTFKDEDSSFRRHGKKIFAISKWKSLKILFCTMFPDFARSLRMKVISEDTGRFFLSVVEDIISLRESKNLIRRDFIQLLLDLKNKNVEESLTTEEMAAQSFVFFLAGFETSSTTMAFALYELAKQPHLQNKVREEIDSVLSKHNGKITYEALHDLKYLNQVIDETLRKYPPLPFLTRKCVKDYEIPDEEIIIKKGTMVVVSIFGIHYDEELYPNPKQFDPDRFNERNKISRHNFAFIPFGEGPRMCIGMRFGLIQSKIGLVSMLKNYKFTVNGKTKEPLKFEVAHFFLTAEGGIWLDAIKLENSSQ